jgi:hypothetical protein
MNEREQSNSLFRAPPLTRTRMILAVSIAVAADALQIALVPLELGFHILLLPTFVVEFIPFVDMVPTWTGCVAAVIALRKREQRPLPTVQTDEPGERKSLTN